MNSVTIDGKNYVKAADIARELGYTADYVGQLCRAGRVDAQLVGRSWYVSDESIKDHKTSRYRSVKAASSKDIEKKIQASNLDSQESYSVSVAVSSSAPKATSPYAEEQFYKRVPEKVRATYGSDESELIPTKNEIKSKTGRLSVSLGDAQSVKIKSRSSIYDFNPTQREELKFSGKLSVTDVEDFSMEEQDEEEGEETTKLVVEAKNRDIEAVATKVSESQVEKMPEITSKIKVKHLHTDKRKKKNLPLEHNTEGVLGMKRGRIASRNPVGGTLQVNVPSANMHVSRVGAYFLVVSCVVSVFISILVLGAETSVRIEGGTLVTSYHFEIRELLATAYSAFR